MKSSILSVVFYLCYDQKYPTHYTNALSVAPVTNCCNSWNCGISRKCFYDSHYNVEKKTFFRILIVRDLKYSSKIH